MRSIGEIVESRVAEGRVDPTVLSVFRIIPKKLMWAMERKHAGSRDHVYACRECWLVAKQFYETMLAIREREAK